MNWTVCKTWVSNIVRDSGSSPEWRKGMLNQVQHDVVRNDGRLFYGFFNALNDVQTQIIRVCTNKFPRSNLNSRKELLYLPIARRHFCPQTTWTYGCRACRSRLCGQDLVGSICKPGIFVVQITPLKLQIRQTARTHTGLPSFVPFQHRTSEAQPPHAQSNKP